MSRQLIKWRASGSILMRCHPLIKKDTMNSLRSKVKITKNGRRKRKRGRKKKGLLLVIIYAVSKSG